MTPHDKTLGPRSRRLYAADVACNQLHGKGLVEKAIEENILDPEDIQRAFQLSHPDEDDNTPLDVDLTESETQDEGGDG